MALSGLIQQWQLLLMVPVGDVRNTPLRHVITAASDGAIAAVYAVKYVEEVAMLHK